MKYFIYLLLPLSYKMVAVYIRPKADENYFKPNPDVSLKVFLATCPQSHPPTAPHPALPYLKAYLNQTLPNAQVTQKDLDAIFFAYVFSPEELAKRFSPEEAARIRQAYEAQRDTRVYKDMPRFIQAHQTLEHALDEISRQHREAKGATRESLTLRGNTFTYVSDSLANSRQGILDAISPENRGKNLFYQYYKDIVVPHILKEGYDVVGFSVFLTDQLIPTFLLASMIKERSPNTKIVLGGNYLSRFRDTLSLDDELNKKLFSSIDAIILNEGEIPFREVLERISKSESLDGVNQLITKKDGRIKLTYRQMELPAMDMDMLPRPDFDGIFTDLEGKVNVFWTPSPVISLYTERGCKWANICDFCSIPGAGNKATGTGARSAPLVAEDMKFYQDKYGSNVFSFGNETLSKQFMSDLTDELDKLGVIVNIDGYTRTDQFHNGGLDREMIRQISKYFRFLQIGFESSDEETLASMRKGRKPAYDSELAKELFENGVMPHAFLLLGFPPKKQDYFGKGSHDYLNYYMRAAIRTLRWLIQNKGNLGTFEPTYIMVPRDDKKMVGFENGKYVINSRYVHEIELQEPRDFEFNIPYHKIHGSRRLDQILKAIFDITPTPFRTYTHNTIYHQRLFNWQDGISWSLQNPDKAELLTTEERIKLEQKLLIRLWNEAVGPEYLEAITELRKKGGVSKEKRARLQEVLQGISAKNTIAKYFPEGISSIDELISFGQESIAQRNPTTHIERPLGDRGKTYFRPLLALAASTLLALNLPFFNGTHMQHAQPATQEYTLSEWWANYANLKRMQKQYPFISNEEVEKGKLNPETLNRMVTS